MSLKASWPKVASYLVFGARGKARPESQKPRPRCLPGSADDRRRANRQENVMKRTLTLAAVAAATALSGFSAHAGCADPRNMGLGQRLISLPPASGAKTIHNGDASTNIVGTWLATYTVGGNAFGQAYIQWHSNGTEWENINLPLSGGN